MRFVEDFERHDEFGFLLPRQVDMAKLALAQWFANFEIVEAPLSWVEIPYLGWFLLLIVDLCLGVYGLNMAERCILFLSKVLLGRSLHVYLNLAHTFSLTALPTVLAQAMVTTCGPSQGVERFELADGERFLHQFLVRA